MSPTSRSSVEVSDSVPTQRARTVVLDPAAESFAVEAGFHGRHGPHRVATSPRRSTILPSADR